MRGLELAVLAADRGVALAIADHLRVRHLALELGEPLLDLLDQLLDHASKSDVPTLRVTTIEMPSGVSAGRNGWIGPMRFPTSLPLGAAALLAICLGPASATSAPSCLGMAPTLVGGSGSTRIQGTPGNDVIFAGAGNDTIAGGDGVDRVCGGDGDDTMDAGTGDDLMDGGEGDDEMHGYNGDDRVEGGPGRDFLDGRRGRKDVLIAGPGRDELIGGSVLEGGGGSDRLDSAGYRRETTADKLDGGSGDDRLLGDSQAGPGELIKGGSGDDELSGAGGNDTLRGETGDDELDGGGGTDDCDQGPGSGSTTGCE